MAALKETGEFEDFKVKDDVNEHSLELHLPFVQRVFGSHPFKIVPIIVGSISYKKEQMYGKLLSEYINDDETLFVISSDFCHWGMSFDYTPYDKSVSDSVSGYIKALDKQGMDIIEEQDGKKFVNYLKETNNTICGRHPITIFLEALKETGAKATTKFVNYAQSGEIRKKYDSSVSYAASYTVIDL